ncbi:hypothetical protein [Nocardia wallacei]|uniref:hypothetical protein n=1 Tax=Nocardia wallacei TaxID=480035 RepID=UPI002456DAB9|nr:hypothetical protein [Nocardia wallacei]
MDAPDQTPRPLPEALARLNKTLSGLGYQMTVQGAVGWAMRGDLDQMRAALQHLPIEKLHEVSVAASALGAAADELMQEPRS